MLSAISNDIAVGFMFRALVDKSPELKAISTSGSLFVEVSLVWKKETYSFSGMRRFREYMRDNNPFPS